MNRANIQLYNEDCLPAMRAMQDKQFDLAIVDPPYGIDINNQSQGKGGGVAKKIEYEMGRKGTEKRYGPRIVDIDILYYGDVTIESDFLTIPHPKLQERNFILTPLSEISPDFEVNGKNIKKFIEEGNLVEKVRLLKNW